jgi:TATA-box binding protein (TBP) (component of TFIID and TFIIIB)
MIVDGFGRHKQKEVTIKIFHNGVFHLTGLPHEDYERHAIDEMMKIMRALPDDCFLEKPVEWIDPTRRVVLMNFTTSFSDVDKLSRIAVQSFFKEKGYRADFEPDVDPAVKVQFAEGWIARIFRTGKINLTALKTTDDCLEFVRRLDILFSDFLSTCV